MADEAEVLAGTAPTQPGLMSKEVREFITDLTDYEREVQTWRKRSKEVIKRYKDERTKAAENRAKFNIFWSNVETLRPAVLARPPRPDIQRRFKDADPVGRVAGEVLERATSFYTQKDSYFQILDQSITDYLLPGQAVIWHRYVPHFRDVQITGNEEERGEGSQISDDAEDGKDEEPPVQEVYYEEVCADYVHPDDFGRTAFARTWQEVRKVWRKAYLDREELVERFGKEKGEKIPLDHAVKNSKGQSTAAEQRKATIYEVWDKRDRSVQWIHKEVPDPLDAKPDPLNLDGFFPCQCPLLANLANDSLVPVPDYVLYQDQARELDDLSARIDQLVKALKVVGVYDASAPGLERILSEGIENKMVPVESWAMFAEKGGISGAVDWFPIDQVAKALVACYEAEEKAKQKIYEITGIADIVRGASKASETATAQQIKGQWASLRVSKRQSQVAQFCRGSVEIMAQVIAEHFSVETLKVVSGIRLFDSQAQKQQVQQMVMMAQQTGQPPQVGIDPKTLQQMMRDPTWEEVMTLLRDDCKRAFRIDIETDSTIKPDEDAEKQARVEFLTALGGFMDKAVPVAQAMPQMLPFLGETLMFGIRAFKVGKSLESAAQQMVDQLEQMSQQPQQQKPDPEMAKVEAQKQADAAKQQAEAQRMMMEQQAKEADRQAEMAYRQAELEQKERQHIRELELQREVEMFKAQMEDQRAREQAERDAMLRQTEIDANSELERGRLALEGEKTAREDDRERASQAAKQDSDTEVRELLKAVMQGQERMMKSRVVFDRGPDGKPSGARRVTDE